MRKTVVFIDHSYSERRGILRMYGSSSSDYDLGEFMDPRGIVSIYRQSDHDFVRMDFMHENRFYTRQWEHWFGDRTLPKLARQFVTDVLGSTL